MNFKLVHFLLEIKVTHKSPNFEPHFQVLWWKFSKFFMLFSKPRVSFSSNFASLSSVMKELPLYFFRSNRKGPIKVQIFETFECSDQNSPNSYFWNNKSIFLQIFSSILRVSKHTTFVLSKLKHYILWSKAAHWSANFWDFWVLRSKFVEFLTSFLN